MKFNLFLLLLTTLIATVLGQIPYKVKVSINPGFATSWAVDETGGVVLEEIGNLWILEFHGFRGPIIMKTKPSDAMVLAKNSPLNLARKNPIKFGISMVQSMVQFLMFLLPFDPT